VAGIVAMAAAMRATVEQRPATVARVGALRDRLADGLLAAVPGTVETGDRSAKVVGNCHLQFPGIESEALLLVLDEMGVAAAAGSACAAGAVDPSHVLTAMGLSADAARSSVRFSLGTTTTDDDVDLALMAVPEAVARLRATA
jgi:cysteine desulfurase